ncbi:hypothetical protein [Photobacterium leiognathi]|uniref:hypothetical protein n=1 Tax=Photobacterium leiognathi TaxID=553611 RepID=UPI002981F61F|nr:hypothetical protein [Photobacterium leiognathi]
MDKEDFLKKLGDVDKNEWANEFLNGIGKIILENDGYYRYFGQFWWELKFALVVQSILPLDKYCDESATFRDTYCEKNLWYRLCLIHQHYTDRINVYGPDLELNDITMH